MWAGRSIATQTLPAHITPEKEAGRRGGIEGAYLGHRVRSHHLLRHRNSGFRPDPIDRPCPRRIFVKVNVRNEI